MTLPQGAETYEEAFRRIEAAVDAGNTDLRALGFWRLLERVKTEPALARHWAEVAGRIDRRAFESRVRLRVPVWVGNLLLALAAIAGLVALWLAMSTTSELVAGLALVVAGGVWSVTWHDLAHWLVGRTAGIRFTSYYLSRLFPPWPGLKTEYETYLRAEPAARAWMHASGAIATKLAPFAALAFWPATVAPAWAAWTLIALGLLQITTDILFSVRRSDWKRVRRELRVARHQAADR
jgi:hypothetical protein